MSIANAAVSIVLASPASSSDRVETYKTALSKKIEEIKTQFHKQLEDQFSQIIRAAQLGVDHNQLRYEAKTLLIDLLDLLQGRKERGSYKFEPKPSIDIKDFTQKVERLKASILNKVLGRLEKFKRDAKSCQSEKEILGLISRIKNFKSRFKKILQKERKLPPALQPAPKPAPAPTPPAPGIPKLYTEVASWISEKTTPQEVQNDFSGRISRNKKQAESAFRILFEAFNKVAYTKKCVNCRWGIIDSLRSFAIDFRLKDADLLKKIGTAYRQYMIIKAGV